MLVEAPTQATLERKTARECRVCRHRLRFEIESDFVAGSSQNAIANLYGISQPTISRHFRECFVPSEYVSSEGGKLFAYNIKDKMSKLLAYMSYSSDDARAWLRRNSSPNDPERLDHLLKFSKITAMAIEKVLATAAVKLMSGAVNIETDQGQRTVQFIIQTAEGVHERDPDSDQ